MTYWAILEKVPGSKLRLTKLDDEIYEHFKQEFPEFDPAATLNEDEMKSKQGKEKWRNWMNQYEERVHDYNFGTIIRSNPKYEYDHDTTIFGKILFPWNFGGGIHRKNKLLTKGCTKGVRMQFYAIEIARYGFVLYRTGDPTKSSYTDLFQKPGWSE